MKDNIHSITKVILIVLLALSVVSGLAFYGLFDFNRTLDMMMGDLNNPYMNEIFYWSAILLGIIVLITILSPIYNIILNPKSGKAILLSIAAFAVVIIIGYALADNEFSEYELEKLKTTAEVSTYVGMGLYTTYITFGITVLSIIYASLVKLFK
ncbi:MAG: hypothetical protein KKB74_14200 [Bacteroidetes bacterium]|nr:hypothetical protein [Bacteroidota bacterium]